MHRAKTVRQRTVETFVFGKLGIGSRKQLGAALSAIGLNVAYSRCDD
jgi:hypothetical protein